MRGKSGNAVQVRNGHATVRRCALSQIAALVKYVFLRVTESVFGKLLQSISVMYFLNLFL